MEKKIIIWIGSLLKNSEGKYLFLKRVPSSSWAQGKWQLPGGKLEWGESIMDTLNREIKEETGGLVANPVFMDSYTSQMIAKDTHFHAVQLVYEGDYVGKTVNISEDHDEYTWTSLDNTLKMDLIDGLRDLIASYMKR